MIIFNCCYFLNQHYYELHLYVTPSLHRICMFNSFFPNLGYIYLKKKKFISFIRCKFFLIVTITFATAAQGQRGKKHSWWIQYVCVIVSAKKEEWGTREDREKVSKTRKNKVKNNNRLAQTKKKKKSFLCIFFYRIHKFWEFDRKGNTNCGINNFK